MYVGLDVHKRFYYGTVMNEEGKVVSVKAKLKCPACGSILKKIKSSYECLNPECDIIRVQFNRSGGIRRILKKGPQGLGSFGRK
jgi:hypothetical protein